MTENSLGKSRSPHIGDSRNIVRTNGNWPWLICIVSGCYRLFADAWHCQVSLRQLVPKKAILKHGMWSLY